MDSAIIDRAIGFYENQPTGQYDDDAVEALVFYRDHSWRPIETAPKNCDILVWIDDAGVDIANWQEYSSGGLWARARCADGLPFRRGNVTHWMPLPDQPVR